MSRSLRTHLFYALVTPLAALWLVASAGILWVIEHEVSEVFDSSLQETAQRLLPLAITEMEQRQKTGAALPYPMPDVRGHQEYLIYQVRDGHGNVALRSHNAPLAPLVPELKIGFSSIGDVRTYTDATDDARYFIHVAEPSAHRRDTLAGILKFLAIPLAAIIPVAILAILWAIRAAQGPINRYGNAVGEVTGANLRPIDLTGLPSELTTIGASVNQLISRLESAIQSERFFAENTAHELRTPLATALAQLQLIDTGMMAPDSAARIGKTRATLLTLEKLVTKLLQLAKAESGIAMNFRKIDLCRITQLIVDDARSASKEHAYRLRLPDQAVVADADVDALGIVLLNLLENATQYANGGTPIEIEVAADRSISIRNECQALDAASLQKITSRYQRATGSGSGLGIGLSIVESIVRQSRGTLAIHSPIPGTASGFQITLRLP
jgi:two-component system, OmpR family, sensor kinase